VSYNEWLDIDVLEDYLDGKLDAKTMYKVEKLSLEDPFVAEALEGLSQSPKRTQTLSLLQKQLQERIAQKPIEKKRWTITSHRLSIAAAAAVLFITVSILFWMKESNNKGAASEQMSAKQKSKKVDVSIAPQVAGIEQPVESAAITTEPDKTLANAKIISKAKKDRVEQGSIVASVPIQEAQNAVIRSAKDSIATFANIAARTAEVDAFKAKAEVAKMALAKKAEQSRETALPGKAPGIYVENGLSERLKENIINGRVYSKNDRQPMPGVTVMVNGSNKATTTNSKGEFTLPIDSNSTQSLSIAYLGFTTKVVNAHGNKPVDVELEQKQNELKEVVIDFKKIDKEQANVALTYTPTTAYYPLGGWQDYESYLLNNNNLTKNGLTGKDVILKFEVKGNGLPTKISIIKSQGKALDNEAIRLLKDGPKWLRVDQNKTGTSQVVVKF
jgi:hypothetical protein